MTKIFTVIGARPQFIKASVVSKSLSQQGLPETVVHTGQHFDKNMSDVFFSELGMRPPDHHLGVGGGRHGEMTARMLAGIEEILIAEKPDVVLVYGDTNSTLAAALAAAKLHIPVAHVEAGLRSFNLRMPEEINRILTDRVSRWLFTPTETAATNLRREGVPEASIIAVGDVMYDVALLHGSKVHAEERVLARLGLAPKSYVLATVHRAENTDSPQRLVTIVDAFRKVAKSMPVVWPVHPRTRQTLEKMGMSVFAEGQLHLIEPVGYLDMVQLERFATVIATDSGGVQKEAFFHEVPCVTLRDETEWVELVEAGWNRLAPPIDSEAVVNALLSSAGVQGAMVAPYGQGDAALRIARLLAGQTS
jgi:UDP-GlcNAc3NAcA epimerase